MHHHQANIITSVAYICLTCSWYIWALRKSWPSVSDQFSFSFSSTKLNTEPIMESNNESSENDSLIDTNISSIETLTGSDIILTTLTSIQENDGHGQFKNGQFYSLWSSGFLALYVVQRTGN